MAFPLVAIAPWAIGAAKGALGLGAKAGAGQLAGAAAGTAARGAVGSKLGAAVAAAKGLGAGAAGAGGKTTLGGAARFAGTKLADAGKFIWNQSGNTTGERLMRLGPDAFFGGLAAVNTPGDLGDKLIAGSTQAIGSIGLGLGASKIPGIKGTAMEGMADMAGSIAGDFGGMYMGDALLRAKGGGSTPWEKVQMEGNEQMRQELEQQMMAQYGLAGYRPHDAFMSDNGLAA